MEKLSSTKRVATKNISNKSKQLKTTRYSTRLNNSKIDLDSQLSNTNLLTSENCLALKLSKQDTEVLQQEGQKPSIQQFPNEIMLHIFKFLNLNDLWFTIRFVCRQWEDLSKCYCLWEIIQANQDVPTSVLQEWLKIAYSLKNLKLSNRKDTDIIIEQVSKCNRQLVSIEARNCWGSNFRRNVKSKPLCNLLRRCPMLSNINFEGTRFISCQFYKIMGKYSLLHSSIMKRRKLLKNQNTKVNQINYSGCANGRQIKAFLLARNEKPNYLASMIFEGLCQQSTWNLNDGFQILHHLKNLIPRGSGDGGDRGRISTIDNNEVQVPEPFRDPNAMELERRLHVRFEDINIDELLEFMGM